MVKKKDAGNVHLNSGELLKFSGLGLAEVLADQSRCLFCGEFFKSGGDLSKTDEHVVPQWVIDYCELGSTRFGQPNRQLGQYGRLTVRCCRGCNHNYNELFEKPISKIFKEGYESVHSLMSTTSSTNLLFAWVAFIAAKKRLYSALLRYDPNPQVDSESFENERGIESISWLLALGRSLMFGNKTLFARFMYVCPTTTPDDGPPVFDMLVDHTANTALIIIGDTSVMCGFSHSCPRELTDARFRGIPRDRYFNYLQVIELYSELTNDALSFEQKNYRLGEYDGKLYLGMDETDTRRTMNIPRSFTTEILLGRVGYTLAKLVTSEDYWNYITSNLLTGRGSFFPDRGREPYFDPALFLDPRRELTDEMFNERLQKLGLAGLNRNPLLYEELYEAYKVRS